jgi:IS30 family transposase
VVNDKSRIGDWEIDTVIGKGHSSALVTIVERVTNFTLSQQVEGKTAETVTKATIDPLKPLKDGVHTITADNGKKFAYHKEISQALRTEFYFAHSYSSWERGLNENTNGLLRQYFPKKIDFKKVTQHEVERAVKKPNTWPRKLLGFRTPTNLMSQYSAVLAA